MLIFIKTHQLLSDTELKVHNNFSLCSFDDQIFLVADEENNITSVIQNFKDIGYYSVNILLDQILGITSGQVKMLLKPEIIQRRSLGTISPISSL